MRKSFMTKCSMKIDGIKLQNATQGVLESKVLS